MLGSFTRVGRITHLSRSDLKPPKQLPHRLNSRTKLLALSYEDDSLDLGYPSSKKTGVVKWFDSKKGYGFIQTDDGSGDVFVHQTSIVCTGYRSLRDGEPVEFVMETREDGKPQAVQVTGPDGEEPVGSGAREDPYFGGMQQDRKPRYTSEPYTDMGRFSSGLQLVVHNLPWSVSEERLMEVFGECNALKAEIMYDDLGRSRGYGIVRFEQKEDAEKAIEDLHMTNVDGRNIMVRFDRYG